MQSERGPPKYVYHAEKDCDGRYLYKQKLLFVTQHLHLICWGLRMPLDFEVD